MTITIYTAEQLKAKGITTADARKYLKGCESRCNSFSRQFVRNGFKCSAGFQKSWDAANAAWDHAKATLNVLLAADAVAA